MNYANLLLRFYARCMIGILLTATVMLAFSISQGTSHATPRGITIGGSDFRLEQAELDDSRAKRLAQAVPTIWQPPTRTPEPTLQLRSSQSSSLQVGLNRDSPFSTDRINDAIKQGFLTGLIGLGLVAVYRTIRAATRGELRSWGHAISREVIKPLLKGRIKR